MPRVRIKKKVVIKRRHGRSSRRADPALRVVWVCVTLAVLLAVGYFGASALLRQGTDKLLALAERYAKTQGFGLSDAVYRSVYFSSLTSVDIEGFSCSLKLPAGAQRAEYGAFRLLAPRISAAYSPKGPGVTFFRLEVFLRDDASFGPVNVFFADHLFLRLSPAFYDPQGIKQGVRELMKGLSDLEKHGKTSVEFKFSGDVYLPYRGKVLQFFVTSETKPDGTLLRVRRDDFMAICAQFGEELTETEIAVYAQYPLQLERLLDIRNTARERSKRAFRENQDVPEDAYRHVLWAYLLAGAVGVGTAEDILHAHELGEKDEKATIWDHEMDMANNRLGIEYAKRGVPESELLLTMVRDSGMVRSAGELRAKTAA